MVALDRRNLIDTLRRASFRISDRSIGEPGEDDLCEESLHEQSLPISAAAVADRPHCPKRAHSIGTFGKSHLKYDLFGGQHKMDLRSALDEKDGEESASAPTTAEAWLQQIAKDRQAKKKAFEPGLESVASFNSDDGAAPHKRWALLRKMSLFLAAWREKQAAKAEGKATQWQAMTEASFTQMEQDFYSRALQGEFDMLFYGAYLPSREEQLFFRQQQDQWMVYQQQQQHEQYMMQMQMQQQLAMQQLAQQQLAQQFQPLQPPSPPSPPYMPQHHHRHSSPPLGAAPSPGSISPTISPTRARSDPYSPTQRGLAAPGSLLDMAKSKEGSLTLQNELRSMSPARLADAIDELAPSLTELCTHTFGNYLVKGMVELPQAQAAIAAALTGNVVKLAAHAGGSRVFQAALKALPGATVAALVAELRGHVADVAQKTNGSWSICEAFNATHAPFIPAEIAAAVAELSVTQDGSRVVQRVLDRGAFHGADVAAIVDAVIAMGAEVGRLANHPFGNYVVQKALVATQDGRMRQSALVALLLPFLLTLSTSKAGSNAAEAIIGLLSVSQIEQARHVLTADPSLKVGADRFGKHVIAALHKRERALGLSM